jgi:DNA-binding MarR family transcriptional regulator
MTTGLPTAHLYELARALPALSWEMRRAGERRLQLDPLPPTELEILRVLVETPGVRATDVAGRLAVKPSNVSAAVTSLVRRGLIERTPDPADRRVLRLHPTARAVRDREQLDEEWATVLAEALTRLPPADARALTGAVGALARLTDTLAATRGERR